MFSECDDSVYLQQAVLNTLSTAGRAKLGKDK